MPRFAANLSFLFTEQPFMARLPAAAAAGFGAVEMISPYERDPRELRAALDDAGLALALFNTPAGDWAAGERGCAALASQRDRFDAQMAVALEYATVLRPGAIHVMAGIDDGSASDAVFVDNLRQITGAAPDQIFTIEPINTRDMPGYVLTRTDQALKILSAVGAPNLRLQLDLYHCQIMEGDLTRRIERLAPHLGHAQIASVPDRAEPDRGELNLAHAMAVLDRVGYRGWVGCEYHPSGRTEDGLGWMTRFTETEGSTAWVGLSL